MNKPILTIFIASTFLACGTAAGQDTSNPAKLEAVYACAVMADDAARLACFDTAVAEFKAAESTGEIVTVSKEEIKEAKKEGFGFNLPSLSGLGKIFDGGDNKEKDKTAELSNEFKSQTFEIERTKTFSYDKTKFYFTNGQVWEQVGSGSVRIPREKDGVKNTALISSAAMGSYKLQMGGKGRSIKVRRVK